MVQVRDANSSQPIAGAKIFVTGEAGGREFVSDDTGTRQIDGVPPGSYVVLADAQVGNEQVYLQAGGGQLCRVELSLGAVAELAPEPEPEPVSDEAIAAHRARQEKGNTLKGIGIGVVTLGAALLVGAAMSAAIGPCGTDGAAGTDCNGDLRKQLAIGFGVSGGLTLGGGIAMIAVGAKRANQRLSASASPMPGGASFSLQGRF